MYISNRLNYHLQKSKLRRWALLWLSILCALLLATTQQTSVQAQTAGKTPPNTPHVAYKLPTYTHPQPPAHEAVPNFSSWRLPPLPFFGDYTTSWWRGDSQGEYNILTLANNNLRREIVVPTAGGVFSTSLFNRKTSTELLTATNFEFWLVLSHELANDPTTVTLTANDFKFGAVQWLKQSDAEQLIQLDFQGQFQNTPLKLSLFYDIKANSNFVSKWLTLQPFDAPDWAIKYAALEDFQTNPSLQPLVPTPRYNQTFGPNQPIFQLGDDKANLNLGQPEQRFQKTDHADVVAANSDNQQGLFFFDASLFGQENFGGQNLSLSNADYVLPKDGFVSGKAVVGMYSGPAEIGFKRYGEYLTNQYAAVKGKPDLVWFNTWDVYQDNINQANLTSTVGQMKKAGFYNMLHIDAGWEQNGPLAVNTSRFPNGLDPLIKLATDAGLKNGLWINPFSNYYAYINNYAPFRSQHPNWVDQTGTQLCPLSEAGRYIHDRLIELVQTWQTTEIYWDGADWNISNCLSADRPFHNPDQEYVLMLKYYANLLTDLHQVKPDLRVIVWNWNAPQDMHWLAVVDQLQLSDLAVSHLVASELIRRQQLYYATFERPYLGIWGDWYGIYFQHPTALNVKLSLLETAEVEMLGNGALQAGGGLDLTAAPPALLTFLKQMYAFRQQNAAYFGVYQHILNFPDGQHIDGEAHLVKGRGFVMLFNPASQPQTVNLPLSEPELELSPNTPYNLSDWSNLTNGVAMGQTTTTNQISVTVPGFGYKVIGINM